MVTHRMSAEGIGEFVESAVHRLLPGYERAPELERGRGQLLFENREAKRLLRFDVGRPKDHVWMIAFSFTRRPDVAALDDRAMPHRSFKSAEIGAFPTGGAEDRARLLRWLEHYAKNLHLIQFEDPFLHRFLEAFPLETRDVQLGMETIRRALSEATLGLRGDIPRSELTLPFGTVFVERDPGYVSMSGNVPPFSRVAVDERRKGPAHGWFEVKTVSFVPGFFMSEAARNRLFADFFEAARRELASVGRWQVAADGPSSRVDMIQSPDGLALEPSRSFVIRLNRGNAAFVHLLEGKNETEWRRLYEHKDAAPSPLAVLEHAIATTPEEFDGYKALADHYAAAGQLAQQNLALGLGYLRARKLPGIARGKLNLARQADSKCPGLDDAFAELELRAKDS
jgi:hypothetical protein